MRSILSRLAAAAERRFGPTVAALAVLGALQGLAYGFVIELTTGDTPGYVAAAKALRHGSYSTPLGNNVGPEELLQGGRQATPLQDADITGLPLTPRLRTALERQTTRTPVYPALVAATGGGKSRPARFALYGVQAALTALSLLLVGLVGRSLFGARVGIAATALAALDPWPKRYVTLILTETLATFLAVAAAYAFVRAWRNGSGAAWVLAGILCGLLTLTRPIFVLAPPLLLLAAIVRTRTARARVRAAVAVVAATAVVVGPWLLYADSATGRVTLTNYGEGWNLLLAAHGEGPDRTAAQLFSDRDYLRDYESVHRFAPPAARLEADPTAHPRYLARADAEQRRLAVDVYEHRLGDEPLTVAKEVGFRAYALWRVHTDWRVPSGAALLALRILTWLTLALALGGAFIASRAGGAARALVVFAAAFTALNAVHHVEARYGIPLRWLVVSLAALALVRLSDAVSARLRA